jgi:mevalonate kinase
MAPAPIFSTYARGKLLLTGEYAVLDGAKALAIPVNFGQYLDVHTKGEKGIWTWESLDNKGLKWFEATFSAQQNTVQTASDFTIARTLLEILQAVQAQNPTFLLEQQGFHVQTKLDFSRAWGLGSSSTLIAALAAWAKVDPYQVLWSSMGGSGYDLACAYAAGPLIYQLAAPKQPVVQQVAYAPLFSQHLYFVYLGKKQNSREGIHRYREKGFERTRLVKKIGDLTLCWLAARDVADLAALIQEHEALISETLDLATAKSLYFSDFWGEIKSLGAWGGDFILALSTASDAETRAYFHQKGYPTVLSWAQMAHSTVKNNT